VQRLLEDSTPSRILDVGAGSGFFSRFLLNFTNASEAWCVDTSYAADHDQSQAGKFLHFRRSVDFVDADLVLFMDVLEHVDDDVALLTEYIEKVPPGSRFLLSVPAFQFLWSGHDVFLEHKRRYTLPQLESIVANSGLKLLTGAYYFGAIFPLVAGLRLTDRWRRRQGVAAKSQLSRHHPGVNASLATLCRWELGLFRWNRLAGLTAFCVAKKP
jgi:SAM-dependent methyltransferase